MAGVSNPKNQWTIPVVMLIGLFTLSLVSAQSQDGRIVADAGFSRYVVQDPIVLDGTGSLGPDSSGPLSYTWRQITGPSVTISDADTATPTISGFVQTDEIQECKFELVVRDGELTSLPDTVEVVIVPSFGPSTIRLLGGLFDPDLPTLVYFGGGDCITGGGGYWPSNAWATLANRISFSYEPDSGTSLPNLTYNHCADILIVYLSALAPDYKQRIQTLGWSTGGQPAIDAAIRLNLTYRDARYAVNRITFFDMACRDKKYAEYIQTFLGSSVDGEQCWIDNYIGIYAHSFPNILNVDMPTLSHSETHPWYNTSLTGSDMNVFNNGVIAGAYWSVVGPGKNLQLASTSDTETYKFTWDGTPTSGHMEFYDESSSPGRLPEPVTLIGAEDGAVIDTNGAALSCEESESAVGYQLLFGRDPHHMVYLFSDTTSPPDKIITTFPFNETWWTVKSRDQYGATIYADPICVNAEVVESQTIENLTKGKIYGSIHHAINNANPGDEIVVGPGVCQYLENINLKGKNLTIRSADPNNPDVVAATIIKSGNVGPAFTFSNSEDASCVLAGLTIKGGQPAVFCYEANPTIKNCTIGKSGDIAIEFWVGFEPNIINCEVLGDIIVRPSAENLTTRKKYAYIQRAIEDAVNGDEIVVDKGIHNETIDFKGKSLTIRSADPNDLVMVSTTIINGNNQSSTVTFSNGEDANCVLDGLMITGGNMGIYCLGTSPTITNCIISGNVGADVGAGILLSGDSSPELTNCTFSGNSAKYLGGGMYSSGGPKLTNCIFWENTPDEIFAFNSTPAITYSNVRGGFPGEGNIDADPLFADADNGDYHLKSEAGRWDPNSQSWIQDDITSPCIDAGDPNSDWSGETWPHGGRINMGAYGGYAQASMSLETEGMTLPRVAYIFSHKNEAAESFESFLEAYGCPTTLIRPVDVPATPLDSYDLIIVANDTQHEDIWSDPNSVAAIEDSGKPVVGLGEGGYTFFGEFGLAIGNPNGMHVSRSSIEVIDPNCSLFSMPYSIEIPQDRTLLLYTETEDVEIHLWPIPETVTAFGSIVNDIGYSPLAMEYNRYLLWGFTESPEKMTEIGTTLFINVVIWTANKAWESKT